MPINIPINICGNSLNAAAMLNPAFGNTCINREGYGSGYSYHRHAGSSYSTAPQQNSTTPTTPSHQAGQGVTEGRESGWQQGPTESTTPTHQPPVQQMMPGGGEETGRQQGSMTPGMPSHEGEQVMSGGHESGSQQGFTESGPGESSAGSDAGAFGGGGEQ
ncbi:chaplin [Streptomyces sp. NPDC057684]|uniref:chaplin n=1 Tax=Streptomyces sp. NPDC057684 TaxID=3346211 RepID=UPI00369ADC73